MKKVRLVKSIKPLCYNIRNWSDITYPLLLVTGLSGSGKTTLAKKIAKKYNAILISFDVLKFYSDTSIQSQELLDSFLRRHPEITKLINLQWSKTDRRYSNDILFNYYCNLFFDFLIEYGKENKKKIVLEGIQLFVRLHPSKSIGMPIIIIRNSSFRSFINKANRDYHSKYLTMKRIKFIGYIINDVYTYHIKQRILLNKYINYLSILFVYNLKKNRK